MKKFLVLFCTPAIKIEEWMKIDPEIRKVEEKKMQVAWGAWMQAHKDRISETAGAGKTKRVTTGGVADVKNDIMLYATVEAESHEVAAKLFEAHPHLQIPDSWIDIMPINHLSGMDGM